MTGPAAELRAATAILTRLPVAGRIGEAAPVGSGAAAFPIVGLGIGLLAAVPVVVLGAAEPVLAAIAALAVVAIVTGGLHLDGLADTTDALMAPDPVRAEAARRDPRIGSGGVIALVLVLGAEVASLASLAKSVGPAVSGAVLLAAMVAARVVPVLVAAIERRRTTLVDDDGFGAWFARRVGGSDVALAAGIAAAVVVACAVVVDDPLPALAAVVGIGLALGGAAAIRHARGRLDGDALGASTELGVVLILASAAVFGG